MDNNDPSAKNPFDFLLDEINKFLKMSQSKHLISDDEVRLPEDIEKRFDEIRKKVNQFVKVSDDIVRLSGVSEEEIKKRLEGVSQELSPDGKKLIQHSKEIHNEAQKISEQLEGGLKNVSLSEKKISAAPEAPPEKTREGKRRSKFKRFGSDKNWKPL